jgi:hypothetical protein
MVSLSQFFLEFIKHNILYLFSAFSMVIATLGPSWNFSLPENLASLSLQDGPRSGMIIYLVQPANQPPSHPPSQLNVITNISQQPLVGSSPNFKLKLRGPNQIEDDPNGR